VRTRRLVVFNYTGSHHSPIQRVVEPFELRRTSEGEMILYGQEIGGDAKSFRLDRMFEPRITDVIAVHPTPTITPQQQRLLALLAEIDLVPVLRILNEIHHLKISSEVTP